MGQLASPLPYGKLPSQTVVVAAIESGFGKICHHYEITGFAHDTNPARIGDATVTEDCRGKTTILFQNGPVPPDGVHNGVTIQSLLAVLSDHLQGIPGDTSEIVKNLQDASGILDVRERRLARTTAIPSYRECPLPLS